MGLLRSVDNVPGIDYYDYRDSQYYGKYRFRARFECIGIQAIWYSSERDKIEKSLKSYHYRVKEQKVKALQNLDALVKLAEFRKTISNDKSATVRMEYHTVSVFSNDLQMLHDLQKFGSHLVIDYTEVQESSEIGTKYFVKGPKHKYRVYLRSKRVDDVWVAKFTEFLRKNPTLCPSTALKEWLERSHLRRYQYTSGAFYIDYDDESMLSYMTLIHDKMLGRRYKLLKRPTAV